MDKFWAYWALAFYILPVMLLVPFIRSRRRGISHLFNAVALRRGGAVKSILGIPYYVGFNLNGFPVGLSLSPGRRNSPAQTSLVAEIPAPVSFCLWICPDGRDTALGNVAKMRDFKGMSAEFDPLFLIKGDNEYGARQFLTADIQAILLKWHSHNVDLGFANNKFCFSVQEILTEEVRLDEFIDDAGLLLDQIGGVE